MFRVRCRMLSGLLVVIMGTCSPSPVRPVVAPKPGASPQAGGQVKLGDFIYTNYGTRDVRGKETQERDAGDFYFKGTFLRGNAGGEIRLKVRNVSGQPHNFSIPAQQLNRDIPPGGDRTEVLVTLPDSGGIRFFCKYHASQGMNGQLLTAGAQPQPLASGAGQEPGLPSAEGAGQDARPPDRAEIVTEPPPRLGRRCAIVEIPLS